MPRSVAGYSSARLRALLIPCLFGIALCGTPHAAMAATILSVDYDSAGAGDPSAPLNDTQPGFSSATATPATIGSYVVSESTSASQSGFYSRTGVSNSGVLTEAALYSDFYYAQNGTYTGDPSVVIDITGLSASIPYVFTFYTYDESDTIHVTPHSTSFAGAGNTTGTGTTASYIAGENPTVNEEYTSTGIYSSTTGTFDILASITSNNDFLRIDGFTVATVPEPSYMAFFVLSAIGLLPRRSRR